jgi:DNA-binding LacI/PurR family transcriptional regulator
MFWLKEERKLMVTRKDVAKRAGVSPAVVSYVLNHSNYVSSEKTEAVLKAVKELHYTPNYMARGLKTNRTFHFAFIGDDVRNEFYTEIVYYMEKYSYEKGYSISLCSSRTDNAFLNVLLSCKYDGIFLASNLYSVDQLNYIASRNPALVFYQTRDYENLGSHIAIVSADYYDGTKQAMQYLLKKGHKHIAYIPPYRFSLHDVAFSRDYRMKAYVQSLQEYGISINQALICLDIQGEKSLFQFVSQMLSIKEVDQRPTAFLIGNDYLATRVIKYLKTLNVSVPENIAIIGMDNTMSAMICTPELTTINVPKKAIACKVVDTLIQQINGEASENVFLPTKLVIRESA